MTSEEFRAWRLRHDWSVVSVCNILGFTRAQVTNMLNGHADIQPRTALTCEACDLLTQVSSDTCREIFKIAPTFAELWDRMAEGHKRSRDYPQPRHVSAPS